MTSGLQDLVLSLTRDELRALVEAAATEGARRALTEMARDRREREVLRVEQVADLLGVSPRSIPKLVHRDGLPATKVGGLLRFRRKDVEAWLETRRVKTPRMRLEEQVTRIRARTSR